MSACEYEPGVSPDFDGLFEELSTWATIQRFPIAAVFELTPYCNLRCPMCYVRLDPAAAARQGTIRSADQWLAIAKQLRDMGTLIVTLTGGEPFLHPEFWKIYNGLTELGMLVSILTNGCLIDEKIVERLAANPPRSIKLSLYGASNETYERMCGDKQGFDRVDHAIDLMKAAGLNFYCSATIVHENLKDFRDLYLYAAKKQVHFFHTIAVTNSARGAISDPLSSRLTSKDVGWTIETVKKNMRPRNVASPFAFCGSYAKTLHITWHGHLQFCAFVAGQYIQLHDQSDMQTAWEQMLEMTEKITFPSECETCEDVEFCKRCPGLLASESGDPSRTSESFCQKARELHEVYRRLVAAEAAKAAESEVGDP